MIEIIHAGWLSLIVDEGRFGLSEIGVPCSSALDRAALRSLNLLLGNASGLPAIEAFGVPFSLAFTQKVTGAITGAKVLASVDGEIIKPWSTFNAQKGSVLRVSGVLEGFRYYIGFAGKMDIQKVMGSFTTNVECVFGGYKGRPLMKGDRVEIVDAQTTGYREVPDCYIPAMRGPHVMRIVDGPEKDYFTEESIRKFCTIETSVWYSVSSKSNRTGVRLEGERLTFRDNSSPNIVSEGILPGTIQVPGDGLPIIVLYERTIGGYPRLGVTAACDLDRLAHLRPKDKVMFDRVSAAEAHELNSIRMREITSLHEALCASLSP